MPDPYYSKSGLVRFLLAVALLLSTLLGALYLAYPSFISSTDNRTTDLIMAMAENEPASGIVVIVDIDEASLARYGQWPWPRSRLAELLRSIDAAGAAAVGLDLILAEPDRTSPVNLQADQLLTTDGPGRQDHDRSLAKTLAQGPFVLGYQFLFGSAAHSTPACGLHPPSVVWVSTSGAAKEPPSFHLAQGVVCNRQLFSDSVARSGFLNAIPDSDGTLRRVPLLIRFGEELYPSLQLAALMQYARSSQLEIVRRGKSDTVALTVAKRRIYLDGHGEMRVNFSLRRGEMPRVSAGELLAGRVAPGRLAKKIAVVGSSAAGLEPTYQTFAGAIRSHVEVHAQVLENLLSGRQAIRTRDYLIWEALLGLALALGTALAVACTGMLLSAALCATMLAATWIGMGGVFQQGGFLFSPLLPTVLVLVNYAALTMAKGWRIERSARRAADQATLLLQESEKKLRAIVTAAPDIIFSLDRGLTVRYASQAMARFTPSPASLLGRPILPFIKKEHRAAFRKMAQGVFSGVPGNLEFEAVRLKTRHLWFDTHLVPLREEMGVISEILGVARDITDRRRAEQALEEKKLQLEALNATLERRIEEAVQESRRKDQILIMQGRQAAMGEMISHIAHQWRQPLNTLALVVQELTLVQSTGGLKKETLEAGVAKAMQLILHMSGTIDDFRNYFRIEKRKTRFKVAESVTRTLSLISPTLKNLEIDVTVATADDCEIDGYPNEYSQVLLNILLNCRDAFLSRPKLKEQSIRITIFRENGRSVVTIADNAGGIAEEILHKVFDPYFTTKGPEQGTGIGLYMAKTIIEKNMGGRISARNAAGGAEFRIEV